MYFVDHTLQHLVGKRENFALLLTNALGYKSFATKNFLSRFTLSHLISLAQFLHNRAVRVRIYFKNLKALATTVEAATISKQRPARRFT